MCSVVRDKRSQFGPTIADAAPPTKPAVVPAAVIPATAAPAASSGDISPTAPTVQKQKSFGKIAKDNFVCTIYT